MPITVGADATVYVCRLDQIFVKNDMHTPSHQLQLGQGRFYAEIKIIFWDTVE